MHDAGWIHHDISPGNILVVKDGFARLVDLEYAQRMDDNARQEIRVVRQIYHTLSLSGTHNILVLYAPGYGKFHGS